MTLTEALILGIIQGLTEFFPVSSSIHLLLVEKFLEIEPTKELLYFHLSCHLGTSFALILYFRKKIFQLLTSFRSYLIFFLALFPLIPCYLLFKHYFPIPSSFHYSGYFLLVTSFLLFLSMKPKEKISNFLPNSYQAFWIGLFQGFALIPGASRSGFTISAARFFQLDLKSAATFSFLLSIPAVFGGMFLESVSLFQETKDLTTIFSESVLIGFVTSFCIGLAILPFSFYLYEKKKIWTFAIYTALLGICIIFFL